MGDVWGAGESLTAGQMALRAAVMFAAMLVLVRLGGVRMFGRKSAFDNVVTIMLGAVAARGIVGASPFLSTIAAAAALVAVHRLLGFASVRWPSFDRLLNGRHVCLYRDGRLHRASLTATSITNEDLHESLRLETQGEDLGRMRAAFLERNGRISFVAERPSSGRG